MMHRAIGHHIFRRRNVDRWTDWSTDRTGYVFERMSWYFTKDVVIADVHKQIAFYLCSRFWTLIVWEHLALNLRMSIFFFEIYSGKEKKMRHDLTFIQCLYSMSIAKKKQKQIWRLVRNILIILNILLLCAQHSLRQIWK